MAAEQPSFAEALARLESLVRSFGRYRRRWRALDGLARFVLVGPGALLAWCVLDWAVRLPAWPLAGLFVAVVGGTLWAAGRWLVKPQLARVVPDREALLIEQLHGRLDNQLIGALQLGRELAAATPEQPLGHSSQLVQALVTQTAAALPEPEVKRLLDVSRAKRLLVAAAVVVLLGAGCGIFAEQALRERAQRLVLAYAQIMDTLFPVTMLVEPPGAKVVRGRPVTLGVTVRGARRQELRLVRTDPTTKEATVTPLPIADGRASFTVAAAMSDFSYRFEYAGRPSPEYEVLVADLPELTALNFELTPPAYTGQAMRLMTGRLSRLQVLAGTTVLVSFAASTPLAPGLCYVAWGADGARDPVEVSGRFGTFAFRVTKPEQLALHLTGQYGPGFEMAEPLVVQVAVETDRPPTVELLLRRQPNLAMVADQATALKVPWSAQDDFGVQEVELRFTVEAVNELLGRARREGTRTFRSDPPRDRVKGRFEALFAGMQPPLAPGDRITLRLTAKDNNTETGPGLGHTEPLDILVVGSGFGEFTREEFAFGERREAALALRGLERIQRETDLLQEPVKTDRTETPLAVAKQVLKATPGQKTMLGEAEDDVGRYFELLSGGGNR